jgi:2-keto-3-deoxy-L-rhamnonate aldolase RhmA
MKSRIEDQNDNRFLMIQIESQLGVKNIEALLDAGGGHIDAVCVGPADFQVDIGKPDSPDAPELERAMRRIGEVCAAREISACANAHSLQDARLWIDRGFSLLTYSYDHGFLFNAAADAREALRGLE